MSCDTSCDQNFTECFPSTERLELKDRGYVSSSSTLLLQLRGTHLGMSFSLKDIDRISVGESPMKSSSPRMLYFNSYRDIWTSISSTMKLSNSSFRFGMNLLTWGFKPHLSSPLPHHHSPGPSPAPKHCFIRQLVLDCLIDRSTHIDSFEHHHQLKPWIVRSQFQPCVFTATHMDNLLSPHEIQSRSCHVHFVCAH